MSKKIIIPLIILTSSIGFGVYYHYAPRTKAYPSFLSLNTDYQAKVEMRPYVAERDKPFIKQQFKENWYLLISSPDYDIDQMLDNRSPHPQDIKHIGSLIIKVLYYNDQPAGFGACYMDSTTRGDILFVEVAQEFRGKKLAEAIVKSQLQDLFNAGAHSVKLATRTENERAQKLYTRLGFTETHRQNGHVYYRIDFN